MSQYPEARFLTSAASAGQLPADDGAEVAFAGRSNAGKSSAINAIVHRRGLARTSKTPGRTQLINFFVLAPGRRLVDLPGYGFARADPAVRSRWDALITGYLANRRSLAALFLIVDVRRGLGEGDLALLELAGAYGLRVHVLLNKADKLKRGRAAAALREAGRALEGRATVQLFSALKRSGLEEARAMLAGCLAGEEPAIGAGE